MYYARIRPIDLEQMRRLITQALEARGWSRDDLLRRLGHVRMPHARRELQCLLDRGDDMQLLRRIGEHLELDQEELTGERAFQNADDYLEHVFEPCVLRVPSSSRPRQIFIPAMAGIRTLLQVASFADWQNFSAPQRRQLLRDIICQDYAQQHMTIFGDILGYAFYEEFGTPPRPYSVSGEPLEGVDVESVAVSAGIRLDRARVALHQGHIPRFRDLHTGKRLCTWAELEQSAQIHS